MDVKCVRVLRPYGQLPDKKGSSDGKNMVIYIDEAARYALSKPWGQTVEALGRRRINLEIQPLEAIDQDGFIARADQAVIDALFVEYGEEILLH